ncbi:YHYH protein [Fulvivirga sp. 29W222]|uniref:YHYH protein n=1 Tax=Fulvivirga marina TaxID=2494733 RepID=A0A937FTJ9_9BACT|nr:YHYH protein [Fulvivirga marina]MBL6445419.1 YHYH protein [Fulvivirga marina]
MTTKNLSNMKIKTTVIAILLFIVSGVALAHPGGHGVKNLKEWHLKGKTSVKGAFLMKSNDFIYLEDEHGELTQIKISELADEDFAFVKQKTEKIEAINNPVAKDEASPAKSTIPVMALAIVLIALILVLVSPRNKSVKFVYSSLSLLFLISLYACNKDNDPTTSSGIAKAYDISFLRETFSIFSNVSYVDTDDDYFYVESNGIPDHQMMVGITAWIERVPTPFKYTYAENTQENMAWPIPINPAYEETDNIAIIDELQRGAIAIATNGIPIFNPYNASGELSWEIGELDAYGGHSGNGDDYHYHFPPVHLNSKTGTYPIAFVLDGFPLYGYSEPDGSTVTGLDEHFGHEDENGYYHYHASSNAPYMTPSLRGVVTVDQEGIQHNQIEPQPTAMTERGLSDITLVGGTDSHEITGLDMNDANNGYALSYKTTTNNVTKNGMIEYSWDDNGLFTFTFTTDITDASSSKTFTYNGDPGTIHADAYGYNSSGSSSDFTLTSAAVSNGELLDTYKCDQPEERSIPVAWSNPPAGTGAFAIVMYHYPNPADASDPTKSPDGYMQVWNIDASVSEIPWGEAGVSIGYIGKNNKKGDYAIGYTSPCSPDPGTHEYTIRIYALSETPASLPTSNSIDVDYSTLVDAIGTVTTLGTASLTFDSVTE